MTKEPWYFRPGVWFLMVIALGAALRFFFFFFSHRPQDVPILVRHARDAREQGLIGYSRGAPWANHPPFISAVESWLLVASEKSGVPFRISLRAPFALLDAGTALLLLFLLGECRFRFVAAAAYWLNPLSIIFSAYHGNTDSAVAFFLLLCVWLLTKQKIVAAAIALGGSLWIKLPIVLAVPAFVFFIPDWRRRFQFLIGASPFGTATSIPPLLQGP